MANAYERHDISDESWAKIEFLLPGRKGTWGGNARDNRQFINAVFWILRTGAPWRDLPPSYGDWKNTHRRFCRWRDKGVWEKLLVELIDNPEFELLMIDASHVKVHAHGSGARGGNQDYVNLDKLSDALSAYDKAISMSDNNELYTPLFMTKKAVIYREQKQFDKEAEIYQAIKDKFPTFSANYNVDVDKYLARAKAEAEAK